MATQTFVCTIAAVTINSGVGDGVGVCVGAGVAVGTGVCVCVSIAVGVGVDVGVGVTVGAVVAVGAGPTVTTTDRSGTSCSTFRKSLMTPEKLWLPSPSWGLP